MAVYVPAVPGTIAPLIVGADGPDQLLFTALDNLIAQKKVPPIDRRVDWQRSSDAQGSSVASSRHDVRRYAEFVETEVCRSSRSSTACD